MIDFFASFIKLLDKWDHELFFKINVQWTNNFFDINFPWWREAETWMPLYLFLFLFILINFGKKGWLWILFALLTIAITDQLSSSLFKDWFNRVRPCNDVYMLQYSRLLLNHCPSSASFTSSHATNHFGAAMFIFKTLKNYFKKWSYLFFVWAASISYGQVYVGVHYPFDVVGGALLGMMIGLLASAIYKKRIGLPQLEVK